MSDYIKLNVGGTIFETTKTTLKSDPDSSLARMFDADSGRQPAMMVGDSYFIDSCPNAFRVILHWLRVKQVVLEGMLAEDVLPYADFFNIVPLSEKLVLKQEEAKLLSLKKRNVPLNCKYCSYITEDISQLEKHQQDCYHESIKKIRCPECNYPPRAANANLDVQIALLSLHEKQEHELERMKALERMKRA